jgi:hypothetical protein
MRTKLAKAEYDNWTDTGCDLHPRCTTCPLPHCRYEMTPGTARAMLAAVKVRELIRSGRTRAQVADELGVSRRTVDRLWLRRRWND